jgi:hypothetical protein
MTEEDSHANEVFIDADAGFTNEKNSYETLILTQMHECVKVLSREMTGGQVISKMNKSGSVEKYVEDVRELVINHVDALRMLMCTYIKDDNADQLKKVLEEIEEYKNNLLDTKTVVPGKGEVKIKDIKGIHVDNPMWKEFINFKAKKYREIFEILMSVYNKQKAYIRSLEEE